MVEQAGHGENLVAGRPVTRVNLQAGLDHLLEVLGEVGADRVVLACSHFGVKTFHGGCAEWRLFHGHLVKNAAS